MLPIETRKRILERAGKNEMCYDHQPPSTRENAIEIAADLARTIEGEYRPLACEAARKLKELHEAQSALIDVIEFCEGALLDAACGENGLDGKAAMEIAKLASGVLIAHGRHSVLTEMAKRFEE